MGKFCKHKLTLMQIKTQPALYFLSSRFETTIPQMMEKAGPLVPQLLQDLLDNQLQLCGPVYWNYFGFSGDESQAFQLEVAIPVAMPKQKYQGNFELSQRSPFRCVEAIHEGRWDKIPETYGKIMAFIQQNQLLPTFENREMYVNADFDFLEANTTVIRMGIH